MKRIKLALAGLMLGSLALSAHAVTNTWWSYDFSELRYTQAGADVTWTNTVTGNPSYEDTWVRRGEDDTTIQGSYSNRTDVLVLNTQGEDLTYTPTNVVAEGYEKDTVLLDADIFFVGSDSDPNITDGTVQFALFLSTPEVGTPALKALAYDQNAEEAMWVELPGTSGVTDKSWHHVTVSLNYDSSAKSIAVAVDGTEVTNGLKFACGDVLATQLHSVSFRGTGAVDSFTGAFYEEDPIIYTTHTFTGASYVNAVKVTGDPTFAPSDTGDCTGSGTLTFPALYGLDETAITKIVVSNLTTGLETEYTATYDAGEGEYTFSPDDSSIVLNETDVEVTVSYAGAAENGEAQTYEVVKVYYGASEFWTITFEDEDHTPLQSGPVAAGTVPAYEGATPTKAATAQYTYTFAGWSPALVAASADATYTATYSETVNNYTVSFTWHDGSTSADYAYGTAKSSVAVPADPASYVDNDTIYTFTGWSAEVPDTITANVTITAQYSSATAVATVGGVYYATLQDAVDAVPAAGVSYTTVTILDDVVLSDRLVVSGKKVDLEAASAVTVTGQVRAVNGASLKVGENVTLTTTEHPTLFTTGCTQVKNPYIAGAKTTVEIYGNVFNTNPTFDQTFAIAGNGLDEDGVDITVYASGVVSNANGIAIYQAFPGTLSVYGKVYGASAITIKDGTLNVYDGAVVAATGSHAGHTVNGDGASPTGDAIQVPYYPSSMGYGTPVVSVTGGTITVADAANGASGIQAYDNNSVAAPDDAESNIAVSGGTFNAPVEEIYCDDGYIPEDNGNGTYGVEPGYAVVFVNYDGTELFATNVAVGGTAVYEGETPVKPDDSEYTYAFEGWTPAVTAVVDADQTYTATYTATPVAPPAPEVEAVDPGSSLTPADIASGIKPAAMTSSGFEVKFRGQVGVTYVLVSSDTPALTDEGWKAASPAGEAVTCADADQVITLTDSNTSATTKFYKIKAYVAE